MLMPGVKAAVAPLDSALVRRRTVLARVGRQDPNPFSRQANSSSFKLMPFPQSRIIGADLRLFVITFLAGFVFVSILLA